MVVRLCEGEFGITRREWRFIGWLGTRGRHSPPCWPSARRWTAPAPRAPCPRSPRRAWSPRALAARSAAHRRGPHRRGRRFTRASCRVWPHSIASCWPVWTTRPGHLDAGARHASVTRHRLADHHAPAQAERRRGRSGFTSHADAAALKSSPLAGCGAVDSRTEPGGRSPASGSFASKLPSPSA